LWARKWVEILEDEMHMGGGKPVEDAITDLGLFYNLLTPFTSFVAVDSEIANRTGNVDTVRQPLPLPEGVSNQAMGSSTGAASPSVVHRMMKSAPMPSVAPQAAPPMEMLAEEKAPSAKKMETRRDRLDDLSRGEAPKGKAKESEKDDRKQACKPAITVDKKTGASATTDLVRLLTQALVGEACLQGKIKLRFTVDMNGHILALDRLDGDLALAGRLAKQLKGKTSATKAINGTATIEISLEIR
jgi:Ca-activated chloride channel family protein